MKLTKIITNLTILIFLLKSSAVAQTSHPILGSFVANEENGAVVLSWVIVSGSTCNGIQIYRSTNQSEFIKIHEIYGICGNVTFAQKYLFVDENPVKNAINNYKLELGGQGFSQVVSVEVIDIESGYQVRPNPANESTRIYFDNNNGTEYTLLVFDAAGRKVTSLSGKQDYFDVELTALQSGIYYFSISIAGTPISTSGKFVVAH
ncbi:MAG: T9SS type A sorting domain-containing protein [Bacteroidia bacterium]